jgi:hypothetical protein
MGACQRQAGISPLRLLGKRLDMLQSQAVPCALSNRTGLGDSARPEP